MRVAVTGANGLFGRGLVRQLTAAGHDVVPLTRADADITDAAAVRAAVEPIRPELIINAAASPDIDACEADPDFARCVNVEGTRNVADAARGACAGLVQISTDAVFDGAKRSPYTETDPTNPPTVYGRTKLDAERVATTVALHWIVRVSVLFGPGKTNFAEKCLRTIAAGQHYITTSDQLGSATYTLDAARTIMALVASRRCGIFHVTNTGECTREELARKAAELAGLDPARVIGRPSAEIKRVPRLKYAVMAHDGVRLAGIPMPRPWQDALAEYVATLKL